VVVTAGSRRRVHVEIDRMVLRGFRAEDRATVMSAFETALQRAFAEPGALDRLRANRALSRLRAGTLTVSAGTAPVQIGALSAYQLARKVGE
jgi:3,4-dihydroxy-2-butanone 4-phosphate synthase